MNQFNDFLKQLDQMDPVQSPQPSKQGHKFAPRKFPKRQYKKLDRHLWIFLICLVVLAGAGASYCNFQLRQHNNSTVAMQKRQSHPQHSSADRSARHSSYSKDLIQPENVKASNTNQGERLLRNWTIKLGLSKIKSRNVLNIYRQTSPFWKRKIAHQLRHVTNNHLSEPAKKQQAYNILDQAKLIGQPITPQNRYSVNTSAYNTRPLIQGN